MNNSIFGTVHKEPEINIGRKSSPLAAPARGIRIVRAGLSLCWLAPLGAEIPNEV